jgi:SAM-dependent methyltransferase
MGTRRARIQLPARILPDKFRRHYLVPLKVRLEKVPYDAKRSFDAHYLAREGPRISDADTIALDIDPLFAAYHYNAVENSIISYLVGRARHPSPAVLDIGSGSGHWIDFALTTLRAESICGVDISRVSARLLRKKYASSPRVRILEADIAGADFDVEGPFDIIIAIGVMFHIVEDRLWERAVARLASLLSEDGIILVGGQFGLITQNVQFEALDNLSRPDSAGATAPVALVNKRIRSLRRWERCAQEAGLEVERVVKTTQHKDIFTPENNVLVLRRARAAPGPVEVPQRLLLH